ncbi:hypothetical protein JN00_0210 [Metamycoplasma subdolum]|uniref:Uncharacterized protein n=1 Tax=Metamycoplasma subdolum TaxID=92407 RepID=A0A3M0A4Z2_9BACT|nr:hypothetical protein [Metamycoplasma subdolum]RMA78569.1 hypothetical protein JN00_0210 [Metamycoplasma subdolum]WPB50292.1 hypothetical protein R9C05_01615 [Metamycoplasma subdolum]
MHEFKPLEKTKWKNLEGGLAISALLTTIFTLIPLGVSAVTSIVGAVKLMSSPKGEFKTKDGATMKWDNSESSTAYNFGIHYVV